MGVAGPQEGDTEGQLWQCRGCAGGQDTLRSCCQSIGQIKGPGKAPRRVGTGLRPSHGGQEAAGLKGRGKRSMLPGLGGLWRLGETAQGEPGSLCVPGT